MSKISYVQTDDFYIEKHLLKTPQSNMHYHHSYELYYLIEGEREYFIGDAFFKVTKGDLVLVPANMLHRTDGKGATRFLLYFKPEFINRYIQPEMMKLLLKDEPFVFHADPSTNKNLIAFMNRLLAEFNKKTENNSEYDELLLIGNLLQILFLMYTEENNYVSEIPENNHMSQIIKFVNENYATILNMEEVADRFFISKFYLCRIFKKNIGVSFISYLNTVRIKAACELLKTDSLFLSEIASRCGFNSTPYFCKVFKAEKGVSPSEYRNKFK